VDRTDQPILDTSTKFDDLLSQLAAAAPALESTIDWPTAQFQWLAHAGVLGWVIPRSFRGAEIPQEDLIRGYDRLATACLTTTFILTQRNGACQRVAGSDREDLKSELLPRLVAGELFATVGISHLTTSRQHLSQPAVQATLEADAVTLNGTVPWVTGAPLADYVVTGGTCDDGRQLLIALPMQLDGIAVHAPARLLALSASHTASIDVHDVRVPRRFVLAGPVEHVMTRGLGGGTGSVATSALAAGLTERSVRHLETEAERRRELAEIAAPLRRDLERLRQDMQEAARGESAANNPVVSATSIRGRANSLVLRATQADLAASKGAGFVAGHPAERAVREAMFFLVWSCPQPVVTAALRGFACLAEA
jgi:alkylation response protein AidB-like acyl-CoA dehydrogenase